MKMLWHRKWTVWFHISSTKEKRGTLCFEHSYPQFLHSYSSKHRWLTARLVQSSAFDRTLYICIPQQRIVALGDSEYFLQNLSGFSCKFKVYTLSSPKDYLLVLSYFGLTLRLAPIDEIYHESRHRIFSVVGWVLSI